MALLTRPTYLLIASLALIFANQSLAQNKDDNKERIKASGTLKGIARGVMHVVSEGGDQYYVKIPDRIQNVKYMASATPEYVQRGMFVRFVGQYNSKGKPIGPIEELKVFTPGREDKAGIEKDAGLGVSQKNLFSDEPKLPQKKTDDVAAYTVTGQLTGSSRGKITVNAGTAVLAGELAKDAIISFEISDLSYVKEGDKVSVDGWVYEDKQQQVYANSLTIVATEKLGAKKPTRRPKR